MFVVLKHGIDIMKLFKFKNADVNFILVATAIALIIFVIAVPYILRGAETAKTVTIMNCVHLTGEWDGKCIPAYESCAEYGLDDWSNKIGYESACFDKDNPKETEELKCCMLNENPINKIYFIAEYAEDKSKYILGNKKVKTIYTGDVEKKNVGIFIYIEGVYADYLNCDKVLLTIMPYKHVGTPCLAQEKTVECKLVEDDSKGKFSSFICGDTAVESSSPFKFDIGGCTLNFVGVHSSESAEEVVFDTNFDLSVVNSKAPS